MCPGWGRSWFATFPPWRDRNSRGTLRTYTRTTLEDEPEGRHDMGEHADVRGHALRLSKTNSYGLVPVCECGWLGAVWPSYRSESANGKPGRRQYDVAAKGAAAEHAQHAHASRPLTATLDPVQYVGTVMQFKRFGHA